MDDGVNYTYRITHEHCLQNLFYWKFFLLKAYVLFSLETDVFNWQYDILGHEV